MTSERWNQMCISEQMLNIGGEIQRAIDRKDKDVAQSYLKKALEWIDLTKKDPKNKGRISEIDVVEEELLDFFKDNKFRNTKESLMSYWNSFFSAIF